MKVAFCRIVTKEEITDGYTVVVGDDRHCKVFRFTDHHSWDVADAIIFGDGIHKVIRRHYV